MVLCYIGFNSPLGRMFLVERAGKLAYCTFDHLPPEGEGARQENTPLLQRAAGLLKEYFAGGNPDFSSLIFEPAGTPFQNRVRAALLQIPYGETVTYGQLAQKIAPPGERAERWSRAAGMACGKNPIAIFVPCHRVIGAGGGLSGYNGGVERKAQLLSLEGSL